MVTSQEKAGGFEHKVPSGAGGSRYSQKIVGGEGGWGDVAVRMCQSFDQTKDYTT